MAENSTTVVTEGQVPGVIHHWTQEVGRVAAAVSYCGAEGYRFFPEKGRPADMRFLIDMSRETVARGLTNPQGVAKLLSLGQVRSLPCLHSKVFLFGNEAALVGSTNLSESSVTSQYQCNLLTTDRRAIRRIWAWFESRWDAGEPATASLCKRLENLRPERGQGSGRLGHALARLRPWMRPPFGDILEREDFKIALSRPAARRAVHLFRTRPCGYWDEDSGVTCADGARESDKIHRARTRKLTALVRRIDRWTKDDLMQVFKIAATHGPRLGRRLFLKQPVSRIKDSMRFLFLEDSVDPFIRFEQVAAGRYKLDGLGIPRVAMLMHTWSPNEFALWNGSVQKGLRVLKVGFRRGFSGHLGQGYKDRTAALQALRRRFGFKSLVVTDHFVDAFGKGHLEI